MFWRGIVVESGGSALGAAEVHSCLPCQPPVICGCHFSRLGEIHSMIPLWSIVSLDVRPLACGNNLKVRVTFEGFDSKVQAIKNVPTPRWWLLCQQTPGAETSTVVNLSERHAVPSYLTAPWRCPSTSSAPHHPLLHLPLAPGVAGPSCPNQGRPQGCCNVQNELCIGKHFCGSHSACASQKASGTFAFQNYEEKHFKCKQILLECPRNMAKNADKRTLVIFGKILLLCWLF